MHDVCNYIVIKLLWRACAIIRQKYCFSFWNEKKEKLRLICTFRFAHMCFDIFFCRHQKDWKINQLIHCNDRFVKGLFHLFPSFIHFLVGGKRKFILPYLKITFCKVLTTYLATHLYIFGNFIQWVFFQFN